MFSDRMEIHDSNGYKSNQSWQNLSGTETPISTGDSFYDKVTRLCYTHKGHT